VTFKSLWRGDAEYNMWLNDWGTEPLTVPRDEQIGTIELGIVVPQVDPVWNTNSEVQVRVCTANQEVSERQLVLQVQLQVGGHLSEQERKNLQDVLLTFSDVFALTDEELGETNLVTHSIDTEDAKPVKTVPRRLPYALRQELEEMKKLTELCGRIR